MTRTPPLRHLYVNPVGECNLSCMHCWITPGRTSAPFRTRERAPGEFTPGQFRDLLDRAAALGLANVKFTGGEPLLRNDIANLYGIAAGHPAGLAVDIETNGTLEPEGIWERFGHMPPRSVAVSLDSSDPSIHDGFRNTKGAWDRAYSFVRRLVEAGVRTQVIMSVCRPDTEPVGGMAALCRDTGVSSLKVNPVQPVGRGRGLVPEQPDIGDYLDFAEEVHRTWGHAVMVDVPPAFLPLDRLKAAGNCPLTNLLGILPDGGISFCGIGFACGELVMGNFITGDLTGIWTSHPLLEKVRTLLPHRLEGICGNCIHKAGCMGSCAMQNYYSSGSLTAPFWMCRMADEAGLFPPGRKIDPRA